MRVEAYIINYYLRTSLHRRTVHFGRLAGNSRGEFRCPRQRIPDVLGAPQRIPDVAAVGSESTPPKRLVDFIVLSLIPQKKENGEDENIHDITKAIAKSQLPKLYKSCYQRVTDALLASIYIKSYGISTWVFIAIGVSLLVVFIIIFLAAVMYRRRKRIVTRSEPSVVQSEIAVIDKRYKQGEQVELAEFEPLCEHQDNRYFEKQTNSIPRVKMIISNNTTNAETTPSLLKSCVSSQEDRHNTTRSLLTRCGDNENKLRGGNGDFHKQYVDVKNMHNELDSSHLSRKRTDISDYRSESLERNYNNRDRGEYEQYRTTRNYRREEYNVPRSTRVSESASPNMDEYFVHRYPGKPRRSDQSVSSDNSPYSYQGRNKSVTSNHSARSYIRIPPTLPSENYIEAAADSVSTYSEPPIKMEWLTKKTDFSPKNEIGNYHSTSGTQTESGVTPPKCLTAEECLISPVVEYHAEPEGHFQRSVFIKLPHSLPEDFDPVIVKVYTFSINERGKVILQCLPEKQKVNDDTKADFYWEKSQDGRTIDISTQHFSGYFCTTCSTSSLPSICSMVFGSHVQITPSRREVRVNLYIWDRRLTIKDYLERIRKQESDVDRQLLTDMQIPLMDDATSDSRLVMRMEVMGEPGERSCWKHICRPDGLSPLFKPLQARRLYDIVHCCRQTDPIRVEWALENAPNQVPGSIFQCCIDIMHVPRDTRDYETALKEDNDDLMRTFYVRDLKVIQNSAQDVSTMNKLEGADLKKIIVDVLNENQTELICCEFGITERDIGNFRRKFTSSKKLQLVLVEECLSRHGLQTFLKLLPDVLSRLRLGQILRELQDRKVLSITSSQQTSISDDESLKDCKHVHRKAPNKHKEIHSTQHQNRESPQNFEKRVSNDSDTVFLDTPRAVSQSSLGRNRRTRTPLLVSPMSDTAAGRNICERSEQAAQAHNKGSSSGSDSVLRGGSIQSCDSFNQSMLESVTEFSVIPQVGSFDEEETEKKEAIQSGSATAYTDMEDKCSNSGPHAFHFEKKSCRTGQNSKPVKTKLERKSPSQDADQTRRKEYFTSTII
ncbi:hypothetical protein Btru_034780 [Bulinus truncatus]|nr:hypothetical protein Btru_034780 [Bulinus truncatus]